MGVIQERLLGLVSGARHPKVDVFGLYPDIQGFVQEGTLPTEAWEYLHSLQVNLLELPDPEQNQQLYKQISAFSSSKNPDKSMDVLHNPYFGRHHWELIRNISLLYNTRWAYIIAAFAESARKRVYTLPDYLRDLERAARAYAPFKDTAYRTNTIRIGHDNEGWIGEQLIVASQGDSWITDRTLSLIEIEEIVRLLWLRSADDQNILKLSPNELSRALLDNAYHDPLSVQSQLIDLRNKDRLGEAIVPFPVYVEGGIRHLLPELHVGGSGL